MNLPSILVTDTNIWIDLENGKILAEIFQLPYQFVTPDFALEEFISTGWQTLQNLGLIIHSLESESVLELARLRKVHHRVSLVDLSALLLARALRAGLVTGDRRLKNLAITHGVDVHGVLWILDEMVVHQVLTPFQAAEALQRMIANGARLPFDDCERRLKRWGE